MENIQIKIIEEAREQDLIQLYQEAGWWDPSTENEKRILKAITKKSALFVGAFFEKKMIGMGRALSDQSSDAYIQDIVVLKPYRGRGIGRKIIQVLIDGLKKKGIDWIGLVAEPGTSSFYERIGFEPLNGHIPLKYKDM